MRRLNPMERNFYMLISVQCERSSKIYSIVLLTEEEFLQMLYREQRNIPVGGWTCHRS
jgi:hypothetical protein